MKWKIFLISLVFIAFSCKNKDEKQSENSIKISERVHYVKDNDGVEIHSGKFKYFIKKTFHHLIIKFVNIIKTLPAYIKQQTVESRLKFYQMRRARQLP